MSTDNDAEAMYFCTERATGLIFEAKFFEDYVVVRPADPRFYRNIRRHGYSEFAHRYEEYGGSVDQIRTALNAGAAVEVLN